ncbi:MAG: hypothetical protein MJY67_07455, partial [Bacteroidales bacterium]|nr:hypothetical protein [Bacteroidales bacterium]
KEGADTGLDKGPDRRAWKRVSDIIKGHDDIDALYTKIIASVVGAKASSVFKDSIAQTKLISGKEVLLGLEKVEEKLKKYQVHELSMVNNSIYRYLETEKIAAKDLDKVKKNVDRYFDILTKGRKEAAAHFATLYVQKTYPNAVSFIAANCQMLVMAMVIYVSNI